MRKGCRDTEKISFQKVLEKDKKKLVITALDSQNDNKGLMMAS